MISSVNDRIVWTQKINKPWFYIENVKQADAIEDLCDGVYVEDKHNPHNWFVMEIREYKNTSNADKKYMVKDWNFYAFIKTRKGLIYVAKMNRKGDLELL